MFIGLSLQSGSTVYICAFNIFDRFEVVDLKNNIPNEFGETALSENFE